MVIADAQGKTMPANTVFAAAMRHLKNHFMEQAQERVELEKHEVRWVITVPAIWNDAAKQVMIEAAKLAGTRKDKLTLAYEPEAAAIYCKQIRLANLREQGKDATIQPFPPGFKFLVLDLGVSFYNFKSPIDDFAKSNLKIVSLGGTVDITAHEVQRDGTLQALIEPSGGEWGGTLVDDGFLRIFEGLFGTDFMTDLKTNIKIADSKRELDAEIEIKKKTIVGKRHKNFKAEGVITFRLPHAMKKAKKSAQLKSALASEHFMGKLSLKRIKFGFTIPSCCLPLKIQFQK
ncbi:HS12B-like protein [Mya arenaria]|uniref:HS12B-like protein n=1 Tax=Mya arenaria TaxID=6604 RepID=A0ABY7EVZ1_MYAAR|nr:HS12B-like protein [Mya arenaria]